MKNVPVLLHFQNHKVSAGVYVDSPNNTTKLFNQLCLHKEQPPDSSIALKLIYRFSAQKIAYARNNM